MLWVIILIVVVVLLLIFFVIGFNRLRSQNVGVDEALGGIDVQLNRRADLIPNLVNTVKGYAAHESQVFENITAARAGVQKAVASGTVADRAAADANLDKAIVAVNAVAENYPDLKASTNFLDLQKQLADTENQIAFSRQYYNDATAQLNKSIATLPWAFFVGFTGVKARDFYKAPEGAATAPTVQF